MLTKLIICSALEDKKEEFSKAQEQWSGLCGVSGFYGQIGGWDIKHSQKAVILGLWHDHAAYREFMNHTHDVIFKNNKQRETYGDSSVTLWKKTMDIPGTHQDLLSVLEKGTTLRIADCVVKEQFCSHFCHSQKDIWNPAMAKTGALLAGAFHQSLEQSNRFLVATIWKDEKSHQEYVEKYLPELQKKAQITRDLEQISGYFISLEKKWFVPAS